MANYEEVPQGPTSTDSAAQQPQQGASSPLKSELRQMGFEEGEARLRPDAGEGPPGTAQQTSSPPATTAIYPGYLIRQGARGDDVATIQHKLNAAGAALQADGVFGPKTHEAVVAFQRAAGILVDGIVGPQTWGTLIGGDQAGPVGSDTDEEQPATPGTVNAVESGGSGDSANGSTQERSMFAKTLRDSAGPAKDASPAQQANFQQTATPPLMEFANMVETGAQPIDVTRASMLAWLATYPTVNPTALQGDPTANQVKMLDSWDAGVTAALPTLTPDEQTQWSAWLVRVRAMRGFYASMLKGVAKPGDMPEQTPVSGQRQTMVGLALAQVGKVVKTQMGDLDETGKPARTGWRALKLYFDTAWGGTDKYPNQDLLRHPIGGQVLSHGQKPGDKTHYSADVLPSWCGIFATWAAKCAGFGVPNWPQGGVSSYKNGAQPKPGDVVNKSAQNHFGIITWVDPAGAKFPGQLKIRTVEGNAGSASVVLQGSSQVSDWDYGVRDIEQKPPKPKP